MVPLFDEALNVPVLVDRVRGALAGGPDYELLLVDDGSRDGTAAACRAAAAGDDRVRYVGLARNYGQSTAMQAGFDRARGEIVVTMDGDLQNDPLDIPGLVERLDRGYDLVAGYREERQDARLTRTLPSRVANALIRRLTGVPIRDTGCTLKAFRREVVERLSLYSDLHRFIPPLAASVGGARIAEMPVRHHPRLHGESKYGLSRIWKVLVDLVAVKAIQTFRERPLRMFGMAAVVSGLLGTAALAGALAIALGIGFHPDRSYVLPGSAFVLLALSAFLGMLGLIGEVVVGEGGGSGGAVVPPPARERIQ